MGEIYKSNGVIAEEKVFCLSRKKGDMDKRLCPAWKKGEGKKDHLPRRKEKKTPPKALPAFRRAEKSRKRVKRGSHRTGKKKGRRITCFDPPMTPLPGGKKKEKRGTFALIGPYTQAKRDSPTSVRKRVPLREEKKGGQRFP